MPTERHIVDYFERLAPAWEKFQRKNHYYHAQVRDLVRRMVPPGSSVLELGSRCGDLLDALRPSQGIGLNVADAMTEAARQKHPSLRFETAGVDQVPVPQGFSPDYVVLTHMLEYVYDVFALFENLRPRVNDRTLLVITTDNPLWVPLLRLASRAGQRAPDAPLNATANEGLCGVLRLLGFDIVERGLAVPVVRRVPLLGEALNAIVPEIPLLRSACEVQYIAARPRLPRPPLSCSVVIPCHNEEGNIEECIRRVPALGTRTEIVVADDGSTDGTREKVLAVMRSDKRVRLVATDRNQGKVNAVRAGFEAASGDALVILDADMTVRPEDLGKFLQPLQEGSADFVNGTRFFYPMEDRAMRIVNYLGNKAFCLLVSGILRQRISDTLCGTKALLKKDYDRLARNDKERWGDFELIFGAARLRLRIREVPVHYHERRAGKSKMRVLMDGLLFLLACWQGWRLVRLSRAETGRPAPASGWREITSRTS